ncbi:hypothetical protein [Methanobrevibacter sp. V74]|uniref:hypothetical protein n=1 Tax=Methanobrevibacter sp. V74 TaxID=3064279 RepID=UPI002733F999|nr:hypothetical protein [Methanobrevibacter sp. V74]
MNIFEKFLKSWWVILSFIMFINGFGFIYIGSKHNNRNWIIEGIIYEMPWFFYVIYLVIYELPPYFTANPIYVVFLFAFLIMFVGIIRSFWVAIKLWNVYNNNEKYALNPTELKNPNKTKGNNNYSIIFSCCLCVIIIFLIFAISAIL